MENDVNYIQALNFIILFKTRGDKRNSKNKGQIQKNVIACISDAF